MNIKNVSTNVSYETKKMIFWWKNTRRDQKKKSFLNFSEICVLLVVLIKHLFFFKK